MGAHSSGSDERWQVELDDAAFRASAQRTARQLQHALERLPSAVVMQADLISSRRRRTSGATQPAYRFIAVPNGAGGTTSISLANATFEELAQVLGGPRQLSALARKVAVDHKPESGVARSACVLKRLRQRAARAIK